MTPDMRRLSMAVAKVRWPDPETRDDEWTDEALVNLDCQAIVRAILTELREVGDECLHVGGFEATRHVYRALGSANQRREVAKDTLGVMIDHILSGAD